MLLGVHVSSEGKIYESIERALKLGCNTMQIFSRNPQRWRDDFLDAKEIAEFKRKSLEAKIRPIFIHIPYLINLASPNIRLYEASIEAYIEDIMEAESLGADYIVTHMGSHKMTSEEEGIQRLILALKRILKKTQNTKIGILLENTSGSGSWIGYKFIHHKEILQALDYNARLGVCLDTAHAFLAGYDLSAKEGLDFLMSEIEDFFGINRLKLIHLNDAKDKLGSHHDRHADIGRGFIGKEGLKRIINHPKLRKIPFILETPKDNAESDKMNLKTVRQMKVS